MDNIGETIGARITSARKNMGLNQRELAKRMGVHPPVLNRYELGLIESPSITNLLKIADACNVTMDYLVGRGDDALEPPPLPGIPFMESEDFCHICTRSPIPVSNPIFCCGKHFEELINWLDKE